MSESKQDYFRCVVETRDNKIPRRNIRLLYCLCRTEPVLGQWQSTMRISLQSMCTGIQKSRKLLSQSVLQNTILNAAPATRFA